MPNTSTLTEQERAQLERWLESPIFQGKAMGLDKLQGFLCAVISSPDAIPPDQWMPDALGGEPRYESQAQAEEVMSLLMKFYDHVAADLDGNHPPALILKPLSDTDPRLDYQSWCDGYILGWALSKEEWLRPGNEALKRLTYPILVLSGAFKEAAERKGREFMPEPEYQKLLQECMNILPGAVAGIRHFWLSKRNSTPSRRESPKVGRNDPCPCGSGKKYKQCCGRKSTLH